MPCHSEAIMQAAPAQLRWSMYLRCKALLRASRRSGGLVVLLAGLFLVTSVQALPTNEDSVATQLAAGRRELDGQHPADAAKRWVKLALSSSDEELVAELARGCEEHQQLEATLTVAEHWLKLNNTSEQAQLMAGRAAVRLFKPDVAAEHFAALLHTAYITPAAGFMELQSKLRDEDSVAALLTFTQLLSQFDDVAEAHYVVARLAAQADNLALMQREAARAHELSPYWSPAGLLLARSQLALGQNDAALTTAQSVVKLDSSSATRAEYASILLLVGRTTDALTLWRELEAQTEGDNSSALRALAQLDFQVGNYQSAFNRFNRLLNTGRNLSETIYYLGNIAERTGARDEARQLYDRVEEGEYAMAAQLRIARLIEETEGLPAALKYLKTYAASNPDAALATYQARANMLNDADNATEALSLLDEAVGKYPDVASVRMAQAFQLLRMNRLSAGLQAMQDIKRLRPQDPVVLNALGYTLVDSEKDLKTGQTYLTEALKLSPDSGAVLDSMGWALFKLGEKEVALGYLERASGRTVDGDIDLHRGEVLWSMGRKQEALQVWQAGASRFPDNQKLKDKAKNAQVTAP